MKSLFFFDDWLLRTREGLDRKQGQPRRVKEVALEHHPELRWIRGASKLRYDELCDCYVTYADCVQKKDNKRFLFAWKRMILITGQRRIGPPAVGHFGAARKM